MGIQLVLLVVFHMPAHDDDGLAHQEHEQALENGKDDESDCKYQQAFPYQFFHAFLLGKAFKRLVGAQVADHKVDGIPDHLGRQHPEHIGKGDEHHTQYEMPFIAKEILIHRLQVAHTANVGQ